jgi:tetratricopeptide (TPR) repeat protein
MRQPPSPAAPTPAPSGGADLPSALSTTGPYVAGPALSPTGAGLNASSGSAAPYFDHVARLISEVADALEYAHQQGVIHRDVKPSNILLSPAGRLSLNDFGLARLLEQPGMTMTGDLVGTPAYMSPEQITAGRIPLDHRTDIYSLGATLYELLTLRPPFQGQSREQVLAQIVQKEPRRPRKVNKRVPLDLETICLKALEKDPDRRYQTAGAMAEDLRRYVNRFAILARRVGPLTRLKKWALRHPGLAAGLACAVVGLLVAGLFAYQAHRADRKRQQQEQQLLAEQRQNALEKALLMAVSGDLDGAEKAIQEAELLGASDGQVRMLRGQVALHRGQTQEAVEHLRQAVALLPESVAARCLLAVAYGYAGPWEDYEQTMREAGELTPREPEDYLFKGHAEVLADPERGLEMLRESARRRPSPVAYLLCAEAQYTLAVDLADLDKAARMTELAVADADTAKRMLPGNAFALWTSLLANMTAANIYAETRQSAKRDAALARAHGDARALGPFSHLPDACVPVWILLRREGKEAQALEKLRRASERTGHLYATFACALTLYRRNDLTGSLAALENARGKVYPGLLRPIVLADLDGEPTRALGAYKDLTAGGVVGWERLEALAILRLLGPGEETERLRRAIRKAPDRVPLERRKNYQPLRDYMMGKTSADELLGAVATTREGLCAAHYYIATTALGEGDRARARKHFRAALATHAWMVLPYEMSWALLGRMEKDPAWPRWIRAKK